MRRLVILMLLCLLPLEVLAGLAYEQELIDQAKHDISWHAGSSSEQTDQVADTTLIETETLQNDSSFDLGESFDVVCRVFKISTPQAHAPPILAAPTMASRVPAVPKPPVI